MANIVVEFFGIARQRAGVATWATTVDTLGELLEAIVQAFPLLADIQSKHFAMNINGERFVDNKSEVLKEGDHILVLSADAGG